MKNTYLRKVLALLVGGVIFFSLFDYNYQDVDIVEFTPIRVSEFVDDSINIKDKDMFGSKGGDIAENITASESVKSSMQTTQAPRHTEDILWSFDGDSWKSNGTPPACPDPFIIQAPVDIKVVTDALWPGQVRGEDYKGHGGFRFDSTNGSEVDVWAPVGSHLVQASQYLSDGDKQYLLFFSVPCGYFYRLDHVRVLSSKLAKVLDGLPPATEGDSRTSSIDPPMWVDQGELLGLQVGVLPANIFVDFGLYYVREPNGIIPNPKWVSEYDADKEFGHYGICFFDNLPKDDGIWIRSLPTGQEGKTSDYCK